ncbi:MAG: response regulator transcription factor [Alistipes sp.]|nr:response regulator transcription factor [Alistipes sp.]
MAEKFLIIEDETAAAVNLKAILRKIAPEAEVVGVLESIEESVEFFSDAQHVRPDLIFMDIHLADGESFKILDKVDVEAPIIFTTAYDEYAIKAFKVNSIDYILKPIKEEEIRFAMEKFSRLTQQQAQSYRHNVEELVEQKRVQRERVFLIHHKDKLIPLSVDDVAFFYTSNERVTATTFDGRIFPIERTLEQLQAMLSPDVFFRANRQFIIARDAVKDIVIWFGARLALNLSVETPEKIIISKARVPEFKQWLTTVHPSN